MDKRPIGLETVKTYEKYSDEELEVMNDKAKADLDYLYDCFTRASTNKATAYVTQMNLLSKKKHDISRVLLYRKGYISLEKKE